MFRGLLVLALLALLCARLGKLWRLVAQAASQPTTPPPGAPQEDPWTVLGVAPGASAETIRAAYRHQIQRYHPDQVAHLGAELREVAERRSKAINAAYAALKRR